MKGREKLAMVLLLRHLGIALQTMRTVFPNMKRKGQKLPSGQCQIIDKLSLLSAKKKKYTFQGKFYVNIKLWSTAYTVPSKNRINVTLEAVKTSYIKEIYDHTQ